MNTNKAKIKVGITGQSGFIGTTLTRLLSEKPDEFQIIPFESRYFSDPDLLQDFVSSCDVVVHLACVNRHPDLHTLYTSNINLCRKLIYALDNTRIKPGLIYSSSIRETENGFYGQAKLECRLLLEEWARTNQTTFSGLVIPNVFGPGAKPFYNSFIATFCRQIIRGEQPVVTENRSIPLLYIESIGQLLVEEIKTVYRTKGISSKTAEPEFHMPVRKVLETLEEYGREWTIQGKVSIPADVNLQHLRTTFLSYL